jgi:hypothetical protein
VYKRLWDARCRDPEEPEERRRWNRRTVKRMVARGADLLHSARARKHHTICGNVVAEVESLMDGGHRDATTM